MRCQSLIFAVLLLSSAWADEPVKTVYVLPLHDEVASNMVYLVRRGVKEAIDKKSEVLILDIDTNGGSTRDMQEIIEIIEKFPHQDQTYTFVDRKAFSAGSYIAEATQNIYMAPGSVIGAMTPVMMGPGGSVASLPASYEKKLHSAYQALARTTAQRHGHDPRVFDAMTDSESGLTIDGVEICPKGKILTLTNEEAAKTYGKPPRPLLSAGTVADLPTLIKMVGGDTAHTSTFHASGFEKTARFLTGIAPVLLAIGLVLAYLEFKLQSFGVLALISAACFAIFFFGQYVAGLSGYEPIVLFSLGVGLILLEVFLWPGLLFPTLLGLGLALMAILVSMFDHYPTQGWWGSRHQLHQPLLTLTLAMGLAALIILVLAWLFPQRRVTEALDRATVVGPGVRLTEGLSVGQLGVACSPLRPAGTARFGIRLVDVITDGSFIESRTAVRIDSLSGSRIVVTADRGEHSEPGSSLIT